MSSPRTQSASVSSRPDLVRRGEKLEYFTIAWNGAEALVSIAAGIIAGSISLIGFGLDSVIEAASGAALLWRLRRDADPSRRATAERSALKIVGWCFLALALYIVCESAAALVRRETPERSIPGIVLAAASLIVMPVLAAAKRRVASGIGSQAMKADSRQSDFCAYLSAILLGGLLLNALFGSWWADPAAGLIMAPVIAREGLEGLRGERCCGNGRHRVSLL